MLALKSGLLLFVFTSEMPFFGTWKRALLLVYGYNILQFSPFCCTNTFLQLLPRCWNTPFCVSVFCQKLSIFLLAFYRYFRGNFDSVSFLRPCWQPSMCRYLGRFFSKGQCNHSACPFQFKKKIIWLLWQGDLDWRAKCESVPWAVFSAKVSVTGLCRFCFDQSTRVQGSEWGGVAQ